MISRELIDRAQENLDDKRIECWANDLKSLILLGRAALDLIEKQHDKIKSQRQQLLRFTRGNPALASFCVYCGSPLNIAGCTNARCGIKQ